jgi:hypothetical protein
MKVAVGLFGIHYIDNLNHWIGWKHGVDYRKTFRESYIGSLKNYNEKYPEFSPDIRNLLKKSIY